MKVAKLLVRVQVDPQHRLVCQAPGCKKPIYADVHVIRDETGAIRVIGSTCYATLSGSREATAAGPSYGWDGRHLTPEERAQMLADTAAFIDRMEALYAAEREVVRSKMAALRARAATAERERVEAEERRRARQAAPVHHFQPAEVSAAMAEARRMFEARGVDLHLPGFARLIEAEAIKMLRQKK